MYTRAPQTDSVGRGGRKALCARVLALTARARAPPPTPGTRATLSLLSARAKAFFPCRPPLPRRHPRCAVADPEWRKLNLYGGCSPEGRPRELHAYPSPSNRAATPAAVGHDGSVVPWAGPARRWSLDYISPKAVRESASLGLAESRVFSSVYCNGSTELGPCVTL